MAALLLVVGAVYGWAWLSVDRSSIARAMVWTEADVDDISRFAARVIPAGDESSELAVVSEVALPAPRGFAGGGASLDELLRGTDTQAFVVVRSDEVVFERHVGGANPDTLHTSFSVAKSILSTLVGIAIDEGSIASVDDPVTAYLPELADRDPRFEQITLRHLLTMSSGLRYEEQELPLPWGDDIDTYYGTDLRQVGLEQTDVAREPGQLWLYNNYNPLLIGMVLERATGTSVSDYASSRLWQPLGAESDASWSLDSEGSGFEKMESGFNATALDFARFGLLFLHDEEWNGTRIVSSEWVKQATTAQATTTYSAGYGYFWWVDVARPGRFDALSNFGQYIYVAPDADTVIVRNGRD